MEELARSIQSYVDAYRDTVSWEGSCFDSGSRQAGDALVLSLRWHVARQIKDSNEAEPTQRRA